MKTTIRRFFELFFPILLSLWIFISFADCVAYFCYDLAGFGIYYSLHGYAFAFVIAFVCALMSNPIRKVLLLLFYGYGALNVIADVVVQYTFHTKFTNDMVEIVRATNMAESAEFAGTFFNFKIVLLCVCVYILGYIVYALTKKAIKNVSKRVSMFLTVIALAIMGLSLTSTTMKHSGNWDGIYLNKVLLFMNTTEDNSNDLKSFRHNMHFDMPDDSLPNTIVLVIGESHSRRHSSLYGYDKNTSPLLSVRQSKGELYVYKDVQSPETQTQSSFKRILNSYLTDQDKGVQKEWNESKTIFDIAKALGYKTFWLSNQSPKGIYDNVPTRFSELCDTALFAGKSFMVAGRMQQDGNYDENVLDLRRSLKIDSNERCMFVYHLMGSHYTFEYRYPKTFKRFAKDDYKNRLENQREILAHYDNSLVYNDYVVNEIIKTVENDDAVVFYYSDHALDVYDSNDSYVGHARGDVLSMEAGKAVPFYIYVSPKHAEMHPMTVERIRNRIGKQFNTGYFFDEFMYVLGLKER